jgi:hypothetical protein
MPGLIDPENRPLRPPLRPPAGGVPQGVGSGNAVSGNGRAQKPPEATAGDRQGDSPHRKAKRARKAPVYARRKQPKRVAPPEKPASEACTAAKEKAAQVAQEIRQTFGERLTREECIRVASAFRSAVVPKRKPGRRRKAHVTAALADWKAGIRGVALFQKHIPGWQKHNRYRRMAEEKRLMDAIRSRDRRAKQNRNSDPAIALTIRSREIVR